jgi:hypothetical protein
LARQIACEQSAALNYRGKACRFELMPFSVTGVGSNDAFGNLWKAGEEDDQK